MAGRSNKSLMHGWHIRSSAQVIRKLRRQPKNSDLILGIGFQWSDKDNSLYWLSYLKKSLMSASVTAFRVNDILVMSTAFTLADSSFLATFFLQTNRWSIAEGVPTNPWYDNSYGFEAILYLYLTNSIDKIWSRIGLPSESNFKANDLSCIYCNKVWSSLLKVVNYSSLFYYTEKNSVVFEELFSVFSLAGQDSGWSMLYYLFEPEMRAFSNSSIAQIPEPK